MISVVYRERTKIFAFVFRYSRPRTRVRTLQRLVNGWTVDDEKITRGCLLCGPRTNARDTIISKRRNRLYNRHTYERCV